MNKYQQDDLEAFILEAQLVNQKVKALANNTLSPEQFDAMENKKIQEVKRKQEKKRFNQQQIQLQRINGRSGKGITKDFKSFCKFCHWEYQFETLKCFKCDKKTITLEERQKQLVVMVENYRIKKAKKEARKQKWDMWKKTQSMLPTKLSTQYTKWQAYTSSEEQEENDDPIVPKDDPNFKALELDLQERKKRKDESNKKANNYKDKGNKLMGEKKYQQAADCYTLALEEVKDNKVLYTNRALAYLRLERWQRAIKDCTTVIQYMQCFEKLDQSPDLAFKAFSRRALAHKERKMYNKALQDIELSLKYNKKDETALRLKKEIENFIKFEEQSEGVLQSKQSNLKQEEDQQYNQKQIIKQLAEQAQRQQTQAQKSDNKTQTKQKQAILTNPVEAIKYYLKNISSQSIQSLLTLLISDPNLKSAFIKLEGIKIILDHLQKQQDKGKAGVLLSYLMDGNGIAEQQIWNSNPHKFEQKCLQILNSLKAQTYSELQDYFEIFISLSLNQKYRILLSSSKQTISFIKKCYPILITKFKKQPQVLNAFIIYFSNLSKGETIIKQSLEAQQIKPILDNLTRIISIETKNKKTNQLKKSIFILLSNLITHPLIKQQILKTFTLLQLSSNELKYFPKSSQIYNEYVESILSLFVNILYRTNDEELKIIEKLNLHSILFQRFIITNKANEILIRSLNIFSKLNYKGLEIPKQYISKIEKYFTNQYVEKGVSNHALRFFNNIYGINKTINLPSNIQQICELLKSENQVLFCNTCNLLGMWADNPEHSSKTYPPIRQYIPNLVHIAKQKVGEMRKSSAILLAKIARDEESKPIFVANHGMEVLKSIAHLVLGRK